VDANGLQAAGQPGDVLVEQERPTRVHADHLVHRVAEQEPTVQCRDANVCQRHPPTINASEWFHEGILSAIGYPPSAIGEDRLAMHLWPNADG
jgi:hypothetical protein